MARSIPVIYNQLLQAKNSQSNLSGLSSTSQVSIWNLWLWITAVGQNLFDQLCDLFQTNIETQIANAPVFTPQWIVQMCKLFQYSSTNPQYLEVAVQDTYPYISIGYPAVNSALQVISQASVSSNTNGQIIIKVAGAGPAPLDGITVPPNSPGTILSAFQSYLNIILPPNTHYVLINDNPDLILIKAQVFYDASYSGVIKASMNAAITAYLASLPFNGVFTVSALEEAMLAVTGVTDVILNEVYWRKATDSPPPATENELVSGNTVISRNYNMYAGYVALETTSGYTLNDLITYTAS